MNELLTTNVTFADGLIETAEQLIDDLELLTKARE